MFLDCERRNFVVQVSICILETCDWVFTVGMILTSAGTPIFQGYHRDLLVQKWAALQSNQNSTTDSGQAAFADTANRSPVHNTPVSSFPKPRGPPSKGGPPRSRKLIKGRAGKGAGS